jgi:hypothetical protein
MIEKGKVGYLVTQERFNITADESFCLNYYYYGYGKRYVSNLKIYAWLSDLSDTIQQLWPPSYREYMQVKFKRSKS